MPKASKFSPDEGITIYDLKDNDAVHWADNAILGAKNLLQNKSTSKAGNVSYTVNNDGSVSLSGSDTSASTLDINTLTGAQIKAFGKQLLLSGGDTKAYIAIRNSNWSTIIRSYGDDTIVDTSTLTDATTYYITIGVQANTNVDGVTIYPMLRLASDTDTTYAPYAKTNRELTTDKFSYSDNGILGAKNLLVYPYSQTSRTVEGVEVTDNGDGTLTLNGTYTGTSYANFGLNSPISVVKNVSVKLGLIIENDDTYNLILQVWNYDGDNHQVICRPNKISDRFVITASTNNGISLQFTAGLIGHTFNNCIVKPFILLASDTDINWRPYAMTNRQLTLKEHTFDGTTDANGVVVASSIPHHPIVYCYGALSGGGNCFVDARPGGGGIAFYCHNNGAKVASTGVKIYYYDYLD